MLENFFLTYANYSLRDDPENLHKIFEEILPYVEKKEDISKDPYLLWLIEDVIDLARFNDPEIAKEYQKKKKTRPLPDNWLRDVAYEAVYKYRGGYCEQRCFDQYGIDLPELIRKSGLTGNERLKCYECYQLENTYFKMNQAIPQQFTR